MTPDPVIDARGLLCPLPVLRLRKRLQALAPGSRVVLLATDPAAAIDVPHFCAQSGHRLLASHPQAEGATAFTVERGPACAMKAGV
ncbi:MULTISPECIES: sulfurtransferase TusA family protein [unclassified Paracoccus (in: a-proteobacteria)]|uniref:sulfurtransferase TusA family protein n=1 Tax=unclassified Paracoccus (in: a-proteobacteria) TaxID=2688777 RepID=UPI0012B2426A|nr:MULTISPECIES: sulfurtransferase TusA family protein [unclassified Paracoccus (in: a-proteobacteria)]UXU75366.1 sulfurtransferase TusA family protein [Paracoccus sp. SMMA_5]UXU81270.1 sulfurtransferase TusA family protein [Paracoccus sp. SMMA_5_TC]